MFGLYGRILLYVILIYQRKVSGSADNEPSNSLGPFTVITDSGNGPSENDLAKYRHGEDSYQIFCVFNDQSPCIELKFKEQSLWKYSSYSNDGYLKSFLYNMASNLLFAMSENSFIGYLCNEQGCRMIKKMDLDGFKPSNLTIVTEDENGLRSENDTNKYDEIPFLGFIDFLLKNEAKCTEIKYSDKSVWAYDGSEYPLRLFMIVPFKLICVVFKDYYLYYKLEADGFKLVSRDEELPFLESDVSLYSEESGTEKLDNTKYRFVQVPKTPNQVFYLNDGTNCTEVRYKDTIVWKQDENQKNVYAKLVTFNWYRKIAFVQSKDSFYVYMYINKGWVQIFKFPEDQKQPDEKPTEPSEPLQSAEPAKPKEQGEDKPKEDKKDKSLRSDKSISSNLGLRSLSGRNILLICLLVGVLFLLLLSVALWFLRKL